MTPGTVCGALSALPPVAALLAAQEALPDPVMTTGAWVFMGAAWLLVIGLLAWSFIRVLGGPPSS